ncbi:hypothetical protein DPMN_051517 [Dreissena polymorpha]|uniref:Uncharacterized protein n=1 Tax=Dreissena polymorpha TaxID=45954 RepID=A0A9D4HQC4_DREPO|nr:hypothetical protein DPMN_051517 [Dreissena polymorpha]
MPPKATGTRWLPHLGKGVDSLVHNFKAYHAHLSTVSHTNPKAEGLARLLLDRRAWSLMSFL